MEIPEGKVLVDFWSPSCGPCMLLMPAIEQIDKEYDDLTVIKLNVTEGDNLTYAQELGVMGLPTLVFFKDGVEVERLVGRQYKNNIVEVIENL